MGFEILKDYSPVLAGTIPIEIDIEGSDLDIICRFKNEDAFTECLHQYFHEYDSFSLEKIIVNDEKSIVSNFILEELPIEVFAQNKQVTDQMAYLTWSPNTKYWRKKEKNLNRK